jgi:Tfp pilus assembly protein PilE
MILHSNRGMTLIELIVFIIVAGIFIPLAYLAYSAALRDTAVPETVIKLRFIAEAKMEDIIRNEYDTELTLLPAQTTFIDVGSPHAGYQWKWTYENITYQDSATHNTTTIISIPPVVSSGTYKVGDYVRSDASNTNFYRAHFLKWVNNTLYNLNDYVVPTSSTYTLPLQVTSGGTSALVAASEPSWSGAAMGQPYEDGGVTWTAIGFPPVAAVWASNTPYSVGNDISPTILPIHYECSGAGKSGVSAPSWPLVVSPGDTVYDGLRWQAIGATPVITLTTVPPSLPWGSEVNTNSGGNQIRWIESNVYRRINVVVRPPGCTTTSCEYSVSTIVTSRTAP